MIIHGSSPLILTICVKTHAPRYCAVQISETWYTFLLLSDSNLRHSCVPLALRIAQPCVCASMVKPEPYAICVKTRLRNIDHRTSSFTPSLIVLVLKPSAARRPHSIEARLRCQERTSYYSILKPEASCQRIRIA